MIGFMVQPHFPEAALKRMPQGHSCQTLRDRDVSGLK